MKGKGSTGPNHNRAISEIAQMFFFFFIPNKCCSLEETFFFFFFNGGETIRRNLRKLRSSLYDLVPGTKVMC